MIWFPSPQWLLAIWNLKDKIVDRCKSPKSADYGVIVLRPAEGADVVLPLEIAGTIKKRIPPGSVLYLFTVSGDGPRTYWPQGEPNLDGQTWRYTFSNPDAAPKTKLRFQLFIVGVNGIKLVKLYRRLNENRGVEAWRPLDELTSDIVACTPVVVVSKPPK